MAAKRTLFFGSPAKLSLEKKQLVVARENERVQIPLEDIGVIVLDASEMTITVPLLGALSEEGIVAVVCDQSHHPRGMFFPLYGHTQHANVLQEQIAVSLPTKKNLWKLLVEAKVKAQASILKEKNKEAFSKTLLSRLVDLKSGDPKNIEGQCARIYWTALFGNGFRRDQEALDLTNTLLNYGYALLRASVARALVACGLSPTLGVHHSNIFNPFALVDDVMEPLRPLVDSAVFALNSFPETGEVFGMEHKKILLEILGQNVDWKERKMPLFSALELYSASFREALLHGEPLCIPKV